MSFGPVRTLLLAGTIAFLPGVCAWAQSKPAKAQVPDVRPLDEKVLHSLIGDREGRALVLNVWATWCLPCVEEFPSLVRLDSAVRGQGVDVVTLSIDFEDEVDGKVRPFLRRMGATMPAYINAYPTPSELIDAISKDWSGAIPATFFYDRSGSLVASAIGQRSYEQFHQLTDQARKNVTGR